MKLYVGLLDSITDATKLRTDLNSLTWELCKPHHSPEEIKDFEDPDYVRIAPKIINVAQ
eukprot:SAG31_NODE_2738_length_5158_cov_1.907492_1_plen_59_part_00